MIKQRIQVYADQETKRRIELAAAKRRIAVTEYCLAAIRQQLGEDSVLEEGQIEIPIVPAKDKELLAGLRALQDKIEARRGGRPVDVDQLLEQTRAERDYELTGLH